jgi:hypothetical protein
MSGRAVILLLGGVLAACDASSEPGGVGAEWTDGGGKEDRPGTLDLAVGDSVELSVVRRVGTEPVDERHAKALRFVAQGSFAVVMRRLDGGDFDPFLALYRDGERVAMSDYSQAALPMADESDAIVFAGADEPAEFTAVAAELELAHDGRFQIDIVPIDAAMPELDLGATSVSTRAIVDALREYEGAFVDGRLAEAGDGTLLRDEGGLDLKSRAELRRTADAIEQLRADLFAWHVSGDETVATAEVAAVLGAVWAELRSPDHALAN